MILVDTQSTVNAKMEIILTRAVYLAGLAWDIWRWLTASGGGILASLELPLFPYAVFFENALKSAYGY